MSLYDRDAKQYRPEACKDITQVLANCYAYIAMKCLEDTQSVAITKTLGEAK